MFYKCKCKLVSHKTTARLLHLCGKEKHTAARTLERKNQFKTHDANDATCITFHFFVPILSTNTKQRDETSLSLSLSFYIYLIGKLLSKINEWMSDALQ